MANSEHWDKLEGKAFDFIQVSPPAASSRMDAGAWKIVIQAEGLAENVARINETVFFDVAAAMDIKDVIFQAKGAKALFWFLTQFGIEVNLDIDADQVVQVELSRRGLRRADLFAHTQPVQPGHNWGGQGCCPRKTLPEISLASFWRAKWSDCWKPAIIRLAS